MECLASRPDTVLALVPLGLYLVHRSEQSRAVEVKKDCQAFSSCTDTGGVLDHLAVGGSMVTVGQMDLARVGTSRRMPDALTARRSGRVGTGRKRWA